MFGKHIANAAVDDVRRLIEEARPEGRHLEYKRDVPLSPEQLEEQRAAKVERPVDRAVAQGVGIGRFGRDELLEELVAFANADGGVLILGMAETATRPPRAAALSPIPHVVALEQALRDAIVSEIEPRLPYAAVRAIRPIRTAPRSSCSKPPPRLSDRTVSATRGRPPSDARIAATRSR